MGDFEEIYSGIARKQGSSAAKRWYWFQLIRSFPSFLTNTLLWRTGMLKNFLIVTYRNLVRQKTYSLLNISGLALGLACSLLILLWVLDEFKFDKYHEDIDQIYQVMEHQEYSDGLNTTINTPGVLGAALKDDIPEIELAATYLWNTTQTFTGADKSFRESGTYASEDLLKILTLPLLRGSEEAQLSQPYTVLISERMASKFFGSNEPIGQSLILNSTQAHTVTGVFENLPDNSSIQFDYLLPYSDFQRDNDWVNDFGNSGPRTIVKVAPNADIDALNARIENFITEKTGEYESINLFLYPFSDRYLHGRFENHQQVGGRIEYVQLFSIVALFVLLIACINFMNLSTAKATKRAKEIGIRKSIGATRSSLISQFMGESISIAFLALAASLLIVQSLLPAFNDLTDKAITINYSDPSFILLLCMIALATGIVSGSYPSFVLSSFEVIKTLKGKVSSSVSALFARKGLVVFQFTLSITLIISTLIIYRQIEFVQNKNLGYSKDNLIRFTLEGELLSNWDTFAQEMQRDPNVISVARSAHGFLDGWGSTGSVQWNGKDPDLNVQFEGAPIDYDLIETMGFGIKQGRSFSRDFIADTSRVLINETAARLMGFENPVGETMRFWERDWEVIGVVEDFHFEGLTTKISPLFMVIRPGFTFRGFVRIRSNDVAATLASIQQAYKKLNPDAPFYYSFMDEQYAQLYSSEVRIGELAKYFAFFAVFISCLGLFGLSAFTAEQRTKEIGIRKVLGATTENLVLLLSKEFTGLVIIAILLATPVSLWLMNIWLSDFAYQLGIEWWLFPAAGLITILIAWLTTGYQSIRAALANPIESIKSE